MRIPLYCVLTKHHVVAYLQLFGEDIKQDIVGFMLSQEVYQEVYYIPHRQYSALPYLFYFLMLRIVRKIKNKLFLLKLIC